MFWGAVIRENQPYVFSKENSGRVFHLSSASLEETLEKKPVYVKIESKDHKYIICVLRGHKNQSMKLDNFLTIIPGIKFSISNCPNAAVHLTGYYESDETLETGVNNTESTNGDKYFSDHKKGSTPKAQSIVSCETKKEKNIKETKKNIPEDKKTSKDTTIEKKVKNVVTEEKKIPAQSNKSLEVKTPPEIITVPSVKKNPLPVPEKKQREIKNEKKDVNAKLLEEDDESDEEYEQVEEDEDEEEENEEEEDDYENLDDMKELNDDDQKEDSQDEKELNLLLNNKSDLKYTIAKGESKVKSENLSDSKPQNQPIDKELEEDDVNSVFKKVYILFIC